jgi:hypothetical protein
MLVDISGEELETYLVSRGINAVKTSNDVPLNQPCTEEEELAKMESISSGNGGSSPHIPIRDTGFYGAR